MPRDDYPWTIICGYCNTPVVRMTHRPSKGDTLWAKDCITMDCKPFIDGEPIIHCPSCHNQAWIDHWFAYKEVTAMNDHRTPEMLEADINYYKEEIATFQGYLKRAEDELAAMPLTYTVTLPREQALALKAQPPAAGHHYSTPWGEAWNTICSTTRTAVLAVPD